MTERWQQVGEQLGLQLPEHVGRLVLPLFDREQASHTVVGTSGGLVVARLIDHGGQNEAHRRNLTLVTATATPQGWAAVEAHAPRELPESPYGPVVCDITDFGKNWIHLGGAPRTGAGATVYLPIVEGSDLEANMQATGLAQLDPLVEAQGIDLFHPDNTDAARAVLRTDFAGHQFGHAMQAAVTGKLGPLSGTVS